jgi:hypothetical protein
MDVYKLIQVFTRKINLEEQFLSPRDTLQVGWFGKWASQA